MGDNYVWPPRPDPPSVQCAPGWQEFESRYYIRYNNTLSGIILIFRCYYFSDTKANTWEEAARTCSSINGLSTLTSVTSKGLMEFILGMVLILVSILLIKT